MERSERDGKQDGVDELHDKVLKMFVCLCSGGFYVVDVEALKEEMILFLEYAL